MMLHRTFLRSLLLLPLLLGLVAPAAEALSLRTTVSVLFIGNSYTYGNDLPGLIAQLFVARGIKLEHESVTPGGATLEKQWANGKAVEAIRQQKWDYVVLQEQSVRPFRDREAMFKAARLLHAEIAKIGAKTLLYETWAAKASPDDQPKLTDAYETLGRELGSIVVPVGEAWKKAIVAGFDLHGGDGRHPNRRGSYLAACLFVSAITSASPIGLPNEGSTEGKPWTVAEAPALQRIAAEMSVPVRPGAPTESAWQKLPQHPRLFANAARWEALRQQVTNDAVSRLIFTVVRNSAERVLDQPPVAYVDKGAFWHGPMRQAQGRILALAMTYRLTGEARFLTRAKLEMRTMAELPNWYPQHFLDTAEGALGLATGLDWLHDALSPEEREQFTTALVEKALRASLLVGDEQTWVSGNNNWTAVCHGGLVVAALAVAEREPAFARQIVGRAFKNMPRYAELYAPAGAYSEGPDYWAYGTTFYVLMAEALRTTFGTTCDLERAPGFLQTADYTLQMTAPSGQLFNFADNGSGLSYEPVMFWFARELRRGDLLEREIANLGILADTIATGAPRGDASRMLPLALLWFDLSLAEKPAPARPLTWWSGSGSQPQAVLRSAWNDPRATFVGIKAGRADDSHAHMDIGSFILEADGVRWAVDLGRESYPHARANGLAADLFKTLQASKRWSIFRCGPESHNLLRFDNAPQIVEAKAEIRPLPPAENGPGFLVDLSPVVCGQVARAERRIRLHPNRSVTIADEWTSGAKATHVTWQWLTHAQVTVTNNGAMLRQQGETLRLRITEGVGAKVEVEDVSKPLHAWDSPNPGLSRILIQLTTPPETTGRLNVLAEPASRP